MYNRINEQVQFELYITCMFTRWMIVFGREWRRRWIGQCSESSQGSSLWIFKRCICVRRGQLEPDASRRWKIYDATRIEELMKKIKLFKLQLLEKIEEASLFCLMLSLLCVCLFASIIQFIVNYVCGVQYLRVLRF